MPIVIYVLFRRKYELGIFFLNSFYCMEMLLVVFFPNITGIRQSGMYGLLVEGMFCQDLRNGTG